MSPSEGSSEERSNELATPSLVMKVARVRTSVQDAASSVTNFIYLTPSSQPFSPSYCFARRRISKEHLRRLDEERQASEARRLASILEAER